MASWEFHTTQPINVHIRVASGDITVEAADTETVTVTVGSDREDAPNVKVDWDNGELRILAPTRSGLFNFRSEDLDVHVTVPLRSSCRIETASGDVRTAGELGTLTLQTTSGDVTVGQAEAAQVTCTSGGVRLHRCGDLRVKSVSGDVHVGTALGDVTCQSVSGDVWVGEVQRGSTEVQTTSGDITVTVVPGLSLRLDLSTMSGDVTSDLSQSGEGGGDIDVSVTCRSMSGDLRLMRAAPVSAP
jgi:DUF4097 and DUF4098 domain-containing protein YvlB